jgi:hypothetical protein
MSFLFTVENRAVKPNTETLLISPFKEIWARDTSKDKANALEDFAYIEFMTSSKKTNPYAGYTNELRHTRLIEDVVTRKSWKADSLIKKAMSKMIEFQEEGSLTYRYYMSNKKAAEQMESFFNDFDIKEVNMKTGNPIYKPKDITTAIKDAEDVLTKLNNLKAKVEQELFESSKIKSQKIISPFADPD